MSDHRNSLLLGIGRTMLPVPRFLWQRAIRGAARKARANLRFMSADHHRVRDFVVMELPRAGRPLSPEAIADALSMDVARVGSLLGDLERRLTFLYRSSGDDVTWAYPVTVDRTPHHGVFDSGEQAYSP